MSSSSHTHNNILDILSDLQTAWAWLHQSVIALPPSSTQYRLRHHVEAGMEACGQRDWEATHTAVAWIVMIVQRYHPSEAVQEWANAVSQHVDAILLRIKNGERV